MTTNRKFKSTLQKLRFVTLAGQAGFVYDAKENTLHTKLHGGSVAQIFDSVLAKGDTVVVEGATAEVLEGSNFAQHAGTKVANVAIAGPLGLLIGRIGREIAVQVTGADGTVLVATTPKKFTTQAHKFVGLVNSRKVD